MNAQPDNDHSIQRLLEEIASSSAYRGRALDELWPILYDELHRLASRSMRNDRKGHTLQTTALIHEAFLKLAGGKPVRWESRAHLMGIAASAMRQILVDHARGRNAAKRGGGHRPITLNTNLAADDQTSNLEMIALESALEKLELQDERTARVAEMRIFSGMNSKEVAEVLGVSVRTVSNDWAMARMWLSRELRG